MKLHRNDSVVVLNSLEDIPGTLTVVGWDEAGEILASSELTSRNAFLLTARLRRVGFHPQGTERLVNGRISVIYAKTCVGLLCKRCEGTGLIPHYGHIANGVCFACKGTGKPVQEDRPRPPPRAAYRPFEGMRLRSG